MSYYYHPAPMAFISAWVAIHADTTRPNLAKACVGVEVELRRLVKRKQTVCFVHPAIFVTTQKKDAMNNEVTIKSGIKRFLLNRYVKYVTYALMLMPVLFMFFKSSSGDYFYKYAIPIAMFVTFYILAIGKNKQTKSGKRIECRLKYRYVIFVSLYFIYTLLYSLLDYYFYDQDYLYMMVVYDCFYALVCSPVIVARTYYTRGLDLLDFMYRGYEDNVIKYILSMVIGFYVVMFGLLFVITSLGLNKDVFSSHVIEGYELIIITAIELLLFLTGYFFYVLYKKKCNDYIYYRPI